MDDLSFVRPDIDLQSVKPLPQHYLIWRVNEFISHTSSILNSFATTFETRILDLEGRLDSFERQLVVLEKKLELIPDPLGQSDGPSAATREPEKLFSACPADSQPSSTPLPEKQPTHDELGATSQKPPEDETSSMVAAKEHPSFVKYFRMLKMGVPEAAVKQKMAAEGVDPVVLSSPDKLLPKPSVPNEDDENAPSESSSSDAD